MKTDLRIKLIFTILTICPLFALAQYNYHNWVENVERDTVQSIEIWRITLQKRLNRIDSLLMDSLLIENRDGSIATTEKYWLQNVDTVVRGNETILRGESVPMMTRFEYPDTALIKKNVFNEEGLLINSKGYFSSIDRPKYLYKSFRYDESNRLIEQIELDVDSNNYYTYTYQFDDRQLTVRRNHLIEDELAQYCIWKYDKKGNLKSIANHWANGDELEWRSMYEHRNNGRMIIEKRFDGKDVHNTTVHIKLDSDDNKLERLIYSADNKFEQGRYYSYDIKGNLTKEKWVVQDGENRRDREHFEYSYNHRNMLMYVAAIADNGNRSIVERYFYNSEGVIESSVVYNEKGIPVTRFEYKYTKKE